MVNLVRSKAKQQESCSFAGTPPRYSADGGTRHPAGRPHEGPGDRGPERDGDPRQNPAYRSALFFGQPMDGQGSA
jgi:hypothetical protein